MKFERPLFILNPVAGTSDSEQVRNVFQRYCSEFGWQADVHETSQDDDLAAVVHAGLKNGCDVVLAGGGDGTVAAVASALIGSETPLGIIPLGTGNQLAQQLGLPANLDQAFEYIGQQPERLCLDAMRIKERYFLLNASVGFSSSVIQETTRSEKRKLGVFAYIWNGLRLLFGIQPHWFNLSIDGESHPVRASEIFISNSFPLSNQELFKDVKMQAEDGELGVFVIKARTFLDILMLLFSLVAQKDRRGQRLVYFAAMQSIEISSGKPIAFQADGETLGTTPVRIDIVHQALYVLAPGAG
jgi:YegS/Rv2252/BmrU family lipid kinase